MKGLAIIYKENKSRLAIFQQQTEALLEFQFILY